MSFLLALFGLALLIVVHEYGHFLVARLCGMRVERFSIGFGNPIVSKKIGDTIFQIAPIPLGGFVHITGLNPHEEFDRNDPYVYPNRPRWMQLCVLLAGATANYLTAIVIAIVIFTAYGADGDKMRVDEVLPDMPAAAAGVKAGDLLVRANDKVIDVNHPINVVVGESKGAPVKLEVSREGQPQTFTITPAKKGDGWLIGIGVDVVLEPVPVKAAVLQALALPYTESVRILRDLGRMITGKVKASLSGPVAITRVMKKAAERGLLHFLRLLTLISIYLGLFNLLPVPSLDGGRAVFVVLRSLGLRKPDFVTETKVHTVGLVLLLGLFVIVTANDILNAFKDMFGMKG